MSGAVQYIVDMVIDSHGQPFSPASCSHVYTIVSGNITVDTATDLQGKVRVKTFGGFVGTIPATESLWVCQ